MARNRMAANRTKLSELSGVSLRSLAAFESGESVPSSETIGKLARALRVSPEFFDLPAVDHIAPEAVSFRKLSKTSASVQRAVLADLSLVKEMYQAIQAQYELPMPSVPDLENLNPKDASEFLRVQWGMGDRPVSNMLHLLESKGVKFAALNPEFEDVDAFCFLEDGVPFVVLNTSRSGERQRFDLAHELGHLVLHGQLELTVEGSKSRESEANEFASNFLMPESALRSKLRGNISVQLILQAKQYWKVSAMALAYRLHKLQMVTDWQYRTICIELAKLGYRTAEPGGIHPESSQLLRKVLFGVDSRMTMRTISQRLAINRSEAVGLIAGLMPVAA